MIIDGISVEKRSDFTRRKPNDRQGEIWVGQRSLIAGEDHTNGRVVTQPKGSFVFPHTIGGSINKNEDDSI